MAKPSPKCETCQRGERYFEGCSHPDCPKRRRVTAAPMGGRGATSFTNISRNESRQQYDALFDDPASNKEQA